MINEEINDKITFKNYLKNVLLVDEANCGVLFEGIVNSAKTAISQLVIAAKK